MSRGTHQLSMTVILPPLVFPGCMHTLYLLHSVAMPPNLELKTRNKQLLGYLTLDIALPRLVECLRVRPEPSFYYPEHGYILRLCPTLPESSLLVLPLNTRTCRRFPEWSTLWCRKSVHFALPANIRDGVFSSQRQ